MYHRALCTKYPTMLGILPTSTMAKRKLGWEPQNLHLSDLASTSNRLGWEPQNLDWLIRTHRELLPDDDAACSVNNSFSSVPGALIEALADEDERWVVQAPFISFSS